MKTQFHVIAMLGVMLTSLSACNGMFDGAYDEPSVSEPNEFGFIEINDEQHSGTIYIDATGYKKWIYIDLHAQTIDSTRIENEAGVETPLPPATVLPQDWDFAVHRYDTKTNGGKVLETGSTGFDVLIEAGSIPQGIYVGDTETTDKITIDMSGMMEGNIKYAKSDYNTELSKWLNVDTSVMPPIYTPSNKVYVLKLKDGTHALIRLADFKNTAAIKGYMKIEYVYPFDVVIKK